MDLTSLIALTRNLAGDPAYEGNSSAWTDDEILAALNWAQTRYAELTHCTYKETAATAPSDAAGIFTIPAGFILVDRVMIPENAVSGVEASAITPSMQTSPSGTIFSVEASAVAGSTFFWSVAGGTFIGQSTSVINVTSQVPSGGIVTVNCLIQLGGQSVSRSVDVPIT